MNNAVEEIREKLRAIRNVCVSDAGELRTQLAEAEKELEQVDAALAAIGEKPGKARKSGRGKSRLPCATKEEVLDVIREVLTENGSVPEDDLKELAGEKLRQRNKSLSMFAALFTKCLNDSSIEVGEEGDYRLSGVPENGRATRRSRAGFGS